jgi:hypothetical protein
MRFNNMTNERFTDALCRLEAAAVRLEAIAVMPPVASGDERLADLEERHRKLRAGTADALARLDRLIATQGIKG